MFNQNIKRLTIEINWFTLLMIPVIPVSTGRLIVLILVCRYLFHLANSLDFHIGILNSLFGCIVHTSWCYILVLYGVDLIFHLILVNLWISWLNWRYVNVFFSCSISRDFDLWIQFWENNWFILLFFWVVPGNLLLLLLLLNEWLTSLDILNTRWRLHQRSRICIIRL